jgi:hypothetical protein
VQFGVDIQQFVKTADSLSQAANAAIIEAARTNLAVNQIELWDFPFAYSQINERGDYFFPEDSQYYFARRGLNGIGFILESLPIFIEKAGYPNFHDYCQSYTVKAPQDTRVLTNLNDGFASVRSLLYHIGVSLYSTNIAQERQLYNFAGDTTWQMAMGEIIAAMANDSVWLAEIVHMPAGFIPQFRQSQFEQQILELRILLADITFIREAHIDPDRDLNTLYWDIYQRFTGLPRHEDIIIWPFSSEIISDPMLSVRKLIAKAIAAQSVKYMTSYFGPFVNNHNTSSFLIQNYFRFGSRYAWSELVQRGTGERLRPVHLKELFKP